MGNIRTKNAVCGDLSKGFDTIDRKTIIEILRRRKTKDVDNLCVELNEAAKRLHLKSNPRRHC